MGHLPLGRTLFVRRWLPATRHASSAIARRPLPAARRWSLATRSLLVVVLLLVFALLLIVLLLVLVLLLVFVLLLVVILPLLLRLASYPPIPLAAAVEERCTRRPFPPGTRQPLVSGYQGRGWRGGWWLVVDGWWLFDLYANGMGADRLGGGWWVVGLWLMVCSGWWWVHPWDLPWMSPWI